MSHKKYIITICIILLAITILGILWYTQKNTNKPVQTEIQKEVKNEKEKINNEIVYNNDEKIDTSDWQTYRNEEYGFEIKYPKNWYVSENKNGFMEVDGKMTECKFVPNGCPILILQSRINQDHVSIDTTKKVVKDTLRINQWHGMNSMLSGCHISVIKNIDANHSFSFLSIYPATDLNNDAQTQNEKQKCENNEYNIFFDEIVKSFSKLKN